MAVISLLTSVNDAARNGEARSFFLVVASTYGIAGYVLVRGLGDLPDCLDHQLRLLPLDELAAVRTLETTQERPSDAIARHFDQTMASWRGNTPSRNIAAQANSWVENRNRN